MKHLHLIGLALMVIGAVIPPSAARGWIIAVGLILIIASIGLSVKANSRAIVRREYRSWGGE